VSTSIHDAISENERRRIAFEKIRDLYPDAKLDGNLWISESLKAEDCNHIAVTGSVLRVGRLIGDKMVALPWHRGSTEPHVLLMQLQREAPELYAQVVRVIAGANP
jgi:hypothetical protein